MAMKVNPWSRVPVHRIYVFTEHGLTPGLVEAFMESAAEAGCRVVVDPFVGSGVVAVEAQGRCLGAVGVDANPWALVVSAAKTRPVDPARLLGWARGALEDAGGLEPLIPSPRLSRYHPRGVLEALGRLRALVEAAEPRWRPLLLAVHASVAERYSLLRRSPAPRLRRSAPRAAAGDVYREFMRVLAGAAADLAGHSFCGHVDLVWADSTLWMPGRVCGVLTSPPFANNIDYIRHSMLALLWAGLAGGSRDLGWLRGIQAPGCEAAARAWRPETEDPEARRLAEAIGGRRARGYRRFLLQYLHSMERHLALLAEALEWQAWYTIGDSILGGAYIPTHRLLARAAERHGLRAALEPLEPRWRPGRSLYLLRLEARR
ncbi:hypothetical protein CF15_05330 [Pyrodictium occultum]|uniref:Uncharacterized protein n=1 Tax=Pyrodictium occultum TaxID=2309 RepID=A0A0V8RVT9_PYROC|nr:hypothetical protein [Pyrodictium occultum]KSW12183.1 hypothetical protein CF15_05330 [Pyrodictium occultum]